MTRRVDVARPRARARAGVLAAGLHTEIGLLLRADGAPTPTGAARRRERRLRGTVILLDEALAFGLRFDFSPDGELTMLRGHARNAAIVIRRELQAALAPGAGPAARGERLRRAGALAGDLTGTIGQIQWRAQAAEAALPDDSWSATWAGRLLSLAAALLPRDRRRAFVEDQCGNLAHAASRREWAAYLVGLLVRMPSIAAALAGD